MKPLLTVMKVLLMIVIPVALLSSLTHALIREGQEVLLYDLDERVSDPYVEINKPPPGTYIPQDIQVTDTVEGRAAVSFTHKDGIHYTLFFNEE